MLNAIKYYEEIKELRISRPLDMVAWNCRKIKEILVYQNMLSENHTLCYRDGLLFTSI